MSIINYTVKIVSDILFLQVKMQFHESIVQLLIIYIISQLGINMNFIYLFPRHNFYKVVKVSWKLVPVVHQSSRFKNFLILKILLVRNYTKCDAFKILCFVYFFCARRIKL